MDDNNFAAVGAIVLHDNKVLLVRHTYGPSAGKLLNPGGMLKQGEMPYDAIKREVLEETGVTVEPVGLIAVRCSVNNWYMAFLCNPAAGEPRCDNCENSEAIYLDCYAHQIAEKYKINVIGGTHYSTEKFACIKMKEYFNRFEVFCEFIEDKPCFEDM